jgi:hypothetical protein
MKRLPLFLFLSGLCLLTTACGDTAPASSREISASLSDDEVVAIRDGWPESLQDLLVKTVYSDRFTVYYRPCPVEGADADAVRPFSLSVAGLALPTQANGDLGCALAGFGHWVLAGRPTGDGRQLLSLVHEGRRLLQVEVETSGDQIQAVAAIINPAERRTLVLRERPGEAANIISRWHKTTTTPMSKSASLGFFRALLDDATFDLADIGIEDPAITAARIAGEPGCKETGGCAAVPPCGPARRDHALLKAAMYSPEDKSEICRHLAGWRHDRHDAPSPDQKIIKRALVLAIQDETPELDERTASGERIVAEYSKSGYRLIVFSELAPMLMTTPRQHFVVSDVERVRCRGDQAEQVCTAEVSVQTFQRALNMPSSVQRDIIESMAREYTMPMNLTFERRSARWELVDPAQALEDLNSWTDAHVTKGFTEYFRERAANWR